MVDMHQFEKLNTADKKHLFKRLYMALIPFFALGVLCCIVAFLVYHSKEDEDKNTIISVTLPAALSLIAIISAVVLSDHFKDIFTGKKIIISEQLRKKEIKKGSINPESDAVPKIEEHLFLFNQRHAFVDETTYHAYHIGDRLKLGYSRYSQKLISIEKV